MKVPAPCRATEAVDCEKHARGTAEDAGFKPLAQLVAHVDVIVAFDSVVLRQRISPTRSAKVYQLGLVM